MKKLECCIVRDLLPTYLEDLTEPETTELVRAHLETCPDCQKAAEQMRTQVPVEKAPAKHPLRFLKRVGRMQWAGAIVSVLLILLAMGWVYDREFHYANTEAGWQAAAEDYLPAKSDADETMDISAGTPLRVLGAVERDRTLYVAYAADNAEHVHGTLILKPGWNHKYRIVQATLNPFPYTAGIFTESFGNDHSFRLALMGDGCREIYTAKMTYRVTWMGSEEPVFYEQTYSIEQSNFFWVLDETELAESFGRTGQIPQWLVVEKMQLFDKDGNDVTAQYQDSQVEDNWGTTKASVGLSHVYWRMGILALLGILIARYFLRNPWKR